MPTPQGRVFDAGYTIVEMLVSTAIIVTVTAGIMAVLTPAQGAFVAQPDVSDMQQRLRFAADTLAADLMMAGAGPYAGPPAGTLASFMAAIVPRRIGSVSPDSPTTAAADRISLMYVPATASQTVVRDPIPAGATSIEIDVRPGCPTGDSSCGFKIGMSIVAVDDTGAHDAFTITGVQGTSLHVRRLSAASGPIGAGAHVAEASLATYWFDSANARLMKYDGDRTDLPMVENLVALRFEYFADPQAPRLVKPAAHPDGPWTTYGPKPPPIDTDNPSDTWLPGENCIFQVDSAAGVHVPRLANLAEASGALVPLTPEMMTDGPWCPDGAAPGGYDADLLRIRQVRVTVRVQATNPALRGAGGPLFTRAGAARFTGRIVPDQEIRFDVTPRNLNLAR